MFFSIPRIIPGYCVLLQTHIAAISYFFILLINQAIKLVLKGINLSVNIKVGYEEKKISGKSLRLNQCLFVSNAKL